MNLFSKKSIAEKVEERVSCLIDMASKARELAASSKQAQCNVRDLMSVQFDEIENTIEALEKQQARLVEQMSLYDNCHIDEFECDCACESECKEC